MTQYFEEDKGTGAGGGGAGKEEKPPLVVKDDGKGGVVVEPPAEAKVEKVDAGAGAGGAEAEERSTKSGGADEDAVDEAEIAGMTGISEADREAIRVRRREERQRRKEHRKEVLASKDREIETLRRQNEELHGRVSHIEQRGMSADLARVDAGIREAQAVAGAAQEDIKAAMAAQDGDRMVKAQSAWYAAQRRLDDLGGLKTRMTEAARRQTAAPAAVMDPVIQRHATTWAERNAWYDPNLGDQDSRIARTIDETLTDEGWDPKQPEYWDEFNARIARHLPHRANGGTVRRDGGRQQQERQEDRGGSRTTGSARDGGAPGKAFTLSPERVQAIKDAGAWDDLRRRDRMIARYQEFDKAQKSGAAS